MSSEHRTIATFRKVQSIPEMQCAGGVLGRHHGSRKDYSRTFKFMCKVAESQKKLHILAAKDTGTAEKNIINKDLGIVDDFGILTQYNGNGTKDDKIPHILFRTSKGDKIVYVMGYGDKKKWQKALGGQYGCLYIDEINTADIDFVREASMRCDYLMATLNPDDPTLPIYKEYINCSRPLPEWKKIHHKRS